jgi:hypothetical protein
VANCENEKSKKEFNSESGRIQITWGSLGFIEKKSVLYSRIEFNNERC